MSDAWRVASIESFEQVPVAPSGGLLRVAARSAFLARPGDPRPTLVADDGTTASRFAAIPAPPDSGGTLRAAFSVPADATTPETVFSLEFADGLAIVLPGPTPGQARIDRGGAHAPDEDEERRSALEPKISELTKELGEARGQAIEVRDAAGFGGRARDTILAMLSGAAAAQAELRATRDLGAHGGAIGGTAGEDDGGELQRTRARLDELEIWSGELERRLAEATTQLSEAQSAARADTAVRAEQGPRAAAPTYRTLSDSELDELRLRAQSDARAEAEHALAEVAAGDRS